MLKDVERWSLTTLREKLNKLRREGRAVTAVTSRSG